MHEEIQLYYYWNVETGETSWEIPQVLVQADHLTNDPLPHASVNNKSNSATVGVDNSNMLSALTNVEKESDSKLKSCSTSLSPSMTYFFNSYKTDDEDTCSVVSIEAENDEERIMDGQESLDNEQFEKISVALNEFKYDEILSDRVTLVGMETLGAEFATEISNLKKEYPVILSDQVALAGMETLGASNSKSENMNGMETLGASKSKSENMNVDVSGESSCTFLRGKRI
ncbi:unnamed protein product [Vicia faba]|uniref:WW domain-containing protein n=1 Tax=Vicia faba TaxID=3906 RepID=A0AAV0Z3V1_VICFA|nr:unnamed protein product [Vicia faba]